MPNADFEKIFEEVQGLIARFAKTQMVVTEETELISELGLDSLLVMEIVQEVEDIFDISFPLNNLAETRTVGDFVRQVQREIRG